MAEPSQFVLEAEELLIFAKKELEMAKRDNDLIGARDVCDKAYLALLKATNALFIGRGMPPAELPKTDRGRFFHLGRLASKEEQKPSIILGRSSISLAATKVSLTLKSRKNIWQRWRHFWKR